MLTQETPTHMTETDLAFNKPHGYFKVFDAKRARQKQPFNTMLEVCGHLARITAGADLKSSSAAAKKCGWHCADATTTRAMMSSSCWSFVTMSCR